MHEISCFTSFRELRAEALRIRSQDHLIQLRSKQLPARAVDFDRIDSDVRNALKFARTAEYALYPPKLKYEVGVYASDGIVPASLHREVFSSKLFSGLYMLMRFLHSLIQNLIHWLQLNQKTSTPVREDE